MLQIASTEPRFGLTAKKTGIPHRRLIELSPAQRAELEQMRANHPKAYMRERASAILQVADGAVAFRVARYGLSQPRTPDTIYAWLDRYQTEGIAGLENRPGRGRKPGRQSSKR